MSLLFSCNGEIKTRSCSDLSQMNISTHNSYKIKLDVNAGMEAQRGCVLYSPLTPTRAHHSAEALFFLLFFFLSYCGVERRWR